MAVERQREAASAVEEDSSVVAVPVLSFEWEKILDKGFLTFENRTNNTSKLIETSCFKHLTLILMMRKENCFLQKRFLVDYVSRLAVFKNQSAMAINDMLVIEPCISD